MIRRIIIVLAILLAVTALVTFGSHIGSAFSSPMLSNLLAVAGLAVAVYLIARLMPTLDGLWRGGGIGFNPAWFARNALGIAVAVLTAIMAVMILGSENSPRIGGHATAVSPKKAGVIQPVWQTLSDGTIPANQWSETLWGRSSCKRTFPDGCGSLYAVQYKKNGEWLDQVCGTRVDTVEFRFKILKSGITEFSIAEECS